MLAELLNTKEALQHLNPFSAFPQTAIVLGSGFKQFIETVDVVCERKFSEIPGFRTTSVEGHGSSLCFARMGDREIIVMTGRIHLYEGYSVHEVVHPVRALSLAGMKNLLLTNAAGGLNRRLAPGDIVVLTDHINLTGLNCLVGPTDALGKRFVDMTNCYDKAWREKILSLPDTKAGIYLGLQGPTYETAAETKLFATFGADVVGMSTVQETIAARQLGIRCAGISFVTNLAAGLSESVDHQEVLDIGKREAPRLARILRQAIGFA